MQQQEGCRDSTRQYLPVHSKDLGGAPVGAHGKHPGHEVGGLILWSRRDAERELLDLYVALGVPVVV